jgi:hypothetical protein
VQMASVIKTGGRHIAQAASRARVAEHVEGLVPLLGGSEALCRKGCQTTGC